MASPVIRRIRLTALPHRTAGNASSCSGVKADDGSTTIQGHMRTGTHTDGKLSQARGRSQSSPLRPVAGEHRDRDLCDLALCWTFARLLAANWLPALHRALVADPDSTTDNDVAAFMDDSF